MWGNVCGAMYAGKCMCVQTCMGEMVGENECMYACIL